MIIFNLKAIIQDYRNKYPNRKLTVTKLSRQTGLSRHLLKTLCNSPQSIKFKALNRLVQFFGRSVSDFIEYVPSGMKLVLRNAQSDKTTDSSRFSKPSFARILMRSVRISVRFISQPFTYELIATPHYISHRTSFMLTLYDFNVPGRNKFNAVFTHNFTADTKRYIYARILAHSGLLTKSSANYADEMMVAIMLGDKRIWGVTKGLHAHDILHNQSVIQNDLDDSVIIDKTTNDFK